MSSEPTSMETEKKQEKKSRIEKFFELEEVKKFTELPKIEIVDREKGLYRLINRLNEGQDGSKGAWAHNGKDLRKHSFGMFSAFVSDAALIPEHLWTKIQSKGMFATPNEDFCLDLCVQTMPDGAVQMVFPPTQETFQSVKINVNPDILLVDKFTEAFLVETGHSLIASKGNEMIKTHFFVQDTNRIPPKEALEKVAFKTKMEALKVANEIIPKHRELIRQRSEPIYEVRTATNQ